MEYRHLGKTDIQVSAICLGTMTFGEQNSEAEAHAQLDYALERGINFIDTAELYAIPPRAETYGRTEEIIGSWLAKRKCRDRLVLASKVAGAASEWLPWIRNAQTRLDRANIRSAIEASLRRLRTDVIDLYQLHWPDRKTNFFGRLGYQPVEESVAPLLHTLEALDELVREGKVRHVGVSNETPWGLMEYLHLAEKHDLPRMVSIQNPYNLLNRSFEVGLAEISHREAVDLLAYSPLAFGVLSGKYLHDQRPAGARLTRFPDYDRYSGEAGVNATSAYVDLARTHGLDPAQMALAFVTSRPFLGSNIIGATTMQQLHSNIDSAELVLDEGVLQGIEAIHGRFSNPCP
jgi:aryl-alcohol dehydrogenase-like predicted oxidoreductase